MPTKTKTVKGAKIHYSYAAHVGQPARRDGNATLLDQVAINGEARIGLLGAVVKGGG